MYIYISEELYFLDNHFKKAKIRCLRFLIEHFPANSWIWVYFLILDISVLAWEQPALNGKKGIEFLPQIQISISLQPDGVYLLYIKLWLFVKAACIARKKMCLQDQVLKIFEFAASNQFLIVLMM